MDCMNIKKIRKESYEINHAHNFDNLDDTDQFLESYKLQIVL